MFSVLYTRVLVRSQYLHGEADMVKNIMKCGVLISIKLVELLMWPVAKVHDMLNDLSDWLYRRM